MAELPREFGPYTLLKALGQGGAGEVYLARTSTPNRKLPGPVVVKCLHAELARDTKFLRRFRHEVELAVAVKSPHVVRVYDAGRVGDTFYIAMEYVAGWTLGRVLADLRDAEARASYSSILDIMRGALRGLEALHSAKHPKTGQALGIVHRDIAPKNIMVGEDGKTRLIDLGLGKSVLQDWRTATGVVMGSPGYMAPEQVRAEEVDARADLYAMGVVLWEFLTLERYISKAPVPVMLRAQRDPKFVPPSTKRRDVPPELDGLLARALAADPALRFQSASEFIAALELAVPEEREEGEAMATLVGEMLWGELGRAKTEVTALMTAPAPLIIRGTPEDLEIYAAATPAEIEEAPPPWLQQPAPYDWKLEGGMATPSSPMPSAPLVMPVQPQGVPVGLVLALMAVMLVLGIGVSTLVFMGASQSVAVAPLAPLPPEPAVAAPVVSPRAVALEPEPESQPRPSRPERAERVERKVEPAIKTEPDTKIEPRQKLLQLMQRAQGLRARSSDEGARNQAATLLGEMSKEAGAAEVDPARIDGFAARLRVLETQ